MTWHTIWCHDTHFDVITNFLTSWCVLYFEANFFFVMTYFMTCLHCPDIFYFIILGTKYYENVFLMSLSLWYIIYCMVNVWRHDTPNVIMPCCWWIFWRHGKFVDVIICFWHHDELFWQICWRHDVFLTSLQTCRCHDMFLTSWHTVWHISDVMTNILFLMSLTCFDVFVTSWLTFWSMLHLLTSWRTSWYHKKI